ncbi:MAG: hypothetical protein DDG59_07990 [Anaerolineae bacterium]|jgi:micrococcal nuclease|nr:MAG: hypothetical protein DDG59_07990 [Anaerolineae bacterium]
MERKNRNSPTVQLQLPLRNRRFPHFLRLVLLFGVLALACDLSQFLPASPPPSPQAGEVTLIIESTPETILPSIEPTITLAVEESQHFQYLPLLSGGGATAEAKGLTSPPTPEPTQKPNGSSATPTVTPTVYATITPIPLSYLCIPLQTPQLGLVTKVIDGDTIRVLLDGKEEKVRYIGIDAPESTTTQEAFGKEATKRNAQLVRNQIVELYRDVSETDRYGRLLRYVVTNSVFVNLKLIEEGYAKAVTYPPDVACATIFQYAERTARELGKGLWVAATPSASPNCDPAYPDVCIPSPPPDLSCAEISFRNFRVLPPDPHGFDGDQDGLGCENQ